MEQATDAQQAVLLRSEPMPEDAVKVKGYDFNQGVDHDKLLQSFLTTGFQATNLGLAIEEVQRMLDWSLADEPVKEGEDEELRDPEARKKVKTKIFLGYTSNMISAGVRDTIRFLVQHKMVDVIVTTAGGIEEDFIKCMADTYLGDFSLKGRDLRLKGINRIGNLLVPNDNYVKFEEWMMPILDQMLHEQKTEGAHWTPSRMIHRLGKEIDNPDSNDIPVYCHDEAVSAACAIAGDVMLRCGQ
ncbi:deoxyhypusine synthase [Salpingoeca rosetta]|uniref:Deoxyhypusine synthase n=1 Tax=Salpingoeca rosetta (strain ATCC 50818 / BSB-021) TaxID=946362 RepID=F2UNB4_SALR5|nr:deoxyhypusine synthase [Salpingoeca rosetta]EGD79119.1 deoxyhypusine synthase [Salpingoeca rosetta]|eukprot:XP_004989204.1 deoxyhypusine synthase [Salpingoeca rosetta]